MQKILIDRFIVPKTSKEEFLERVRINRSFIKTIPGFVSDSVYIREEEGNRFYFVTFAIWESQEALETAKKAVLAEYQKQGFVLNAMSNRIGISFERGIFEEATSSKFQEVSA
ncbi:antibiotic biosynthesis monooxygenase [Leptospira broomii serovar Hurstbridge str. 5399]|uniref:Antibiotic biosynthesis monooxygenase n=1 Tax=Leptospira broomii serovar Hurstbridge str. 5399 TaxID=1049789 RepID=T0F806_9LEPT|nr:antibiotic biosynthesis monooxygenase family protein [Leptospira broomii]EQA43612.1 antibiotic biosynthesis monooxygenase [Leptospira broomii serovar Hurstbridge str. 5399]